MLNCKILAVIATAGMMTLAGGEVVQARPTSQTIIGEIQGIRLGALGVSPATVANSWQRGIITVGGMDVIIPANLVIQMPVERFTLTELFTKAPPACVAVGQTGLARGDSCFPGLRGGIVTILANRMDTGEVIAGVVNIDKAPEALMGVVTYIDYDQGFFRVNGSPHSATTGVMVRINDPIGRHTIQKGLGCPSASATITGTGINCSPDIRFPVDNENYTVTFATGVPLCIPSTFTNAVRTAGNVANPTTGLGDKLCPMWGRTIDPLVATIPTAQAFNLVPMVLGDSLQAEGSFEVVGGVKFFSAHTIMVHARIMTQPGNPDYMIFDEVEWDTAGYTNQRARVRIIGFTSLSTSQLDVYAVHNMITAPQVSEGFEFPLATTIGNPFAINMGAPPFGGSIFKMIVDVDFLIGAKPRHAPCSILFNGGFQTPATGGCPSGSTSSIAENFRIIATLSRDVVGRTRNQFQFNVADSKDIQGRDTPNGQYVNPVDAAPPNPFETNVNGISSAFLFTGQPWLLDRRLGPTGCGKVAGDCPVSMSAATQATMRLNPWPWDGGVPPGADPENPPTLSVPEGERTSMLRFLTKATPASAPAFNGAILSLPTGPSAVTPVTVSGAPKVKQCATTL
jgi:hypothetical protein